MKKAVVAVLSAALCFALFYGILSGAPQKNEGADPLLEVLDRTVADKDTYAQLRQNRIDSLKRELVRETDPEQQLKTVQGIINLYFDFQNDQAMEYAVMMRDMARKYYGTDPDYLMRAEVNLARLLRYTGQLKESTEMLDRIARHRLSPAVHYLYVSERVINYTFLRDNSPTPEYKEYYDMMAEVYRDSVFMNTAAKAGLTVRVERFLKQNDPRSALDMLHDEYDTLDPLSRRAGTLAYNIALCHEAMGDKENFRDYLIRSAIADLRSGVRGYKSLQRLAGVMYHSDDIDRAYSYMRCSMEDAIRSSARIRAQEASEMFVIIDRSYQQKVAQQKKSAFTYLTTIAVVGVLLLLSLFVISYQNTRLAAAKRKLSDLNLVKEGYLGVFIEEYSNYLSRMNSYRLKAAKIVKKGDLDEIERFMDKAFNTTDDLKELYRKFDATILHIFPTFIEEYNLLMNESGTVRKGEGAELTAEQRIAAFIRLGIRETDKIALFLRYSVRTVYNYRSQMRTKAKNSKDFERDIMRIGLGNNS